MDGAAHERLLRLLWIGSGVGCSLMASLAVVCGVVIFAGSAWAVDDGNASKKAKMANIKCFKCGKQGHYSDKCKGS